MDYQWDSSSGNLNDLLTCNIGEIVTYPGTTNPFPRPSPPFAAGGHSNPTVFSFTAETGLMGDLHIVLGFGTFVKPYSASQYTATQYYRFQCQCQCHNNNAWADLMGPLAITRSVSQNANGTWKYTITKPTNQRRGNTESVAALRCPT